MADITQVTPVGIPKEIEEIIRQYGMIVQTYQHVIEVWARPPMMLSRLREIEEVAHKAYPPQKGSGEVLG